MNAIIKQNGINFGLILGLLLALVTLLGYAVNNEILVSYWSFVYIFLTIIVVGIIAIAYSKKGLGGFISFKEGFTTYFIMLVIGVFISVLVNFLIFNIVDTDFQEVMKEKTIEKIESQRDYWVGKMIDGGTNESKIEEMETQFDKSIEEIRNTNQYGIGKQVQGFFMFTAIFSIFGLLLALILKRKDPSLA
ncbi:MAG: DUF4199 domain-containing protein [Flavobacteriaceae bacterium]|nr:DUF4199 domain-containing protein [Flavobacteriaceae bacterium]